MVRAEAHFNTRNQENTWPGHTSRVDDIVALRSEVAKLNQRLQTSYEGTSNTSVSSNAGRWAWKKRPPSQDQPVTKMVDGKTYHWCHKHHAWTIHSPEQCLGKRKKLPFQPVANEVETTFTNQQNNQTPTRLVLNTQLQAVLDAACQSNE